MDTARWGWWRRHGLTVALLCTAAGLAFFVRSLWMFQLIQQYGASYLFGGGSDSFYHFRVSYYIVQNHTNLIVDPLLKYPFGAINPREPLFDWMNAILAIVFAGAFGGNTVASTSFFLEMGGPIWAALGVVPVYLIGKEVSDKRVGLIAAFLYAVSVANINSSTLGYANYLSFYLFFILLTVFGYLKTIHYAGTRRWVETYRRPGQIPGAIRNFVRTERQATKWAVFTGVSFGALALAWQGYSLVVAAMIIFMVLALLVERVRRVDSFGLYVVTWIIGLIGFPMAAPYYYVQGLIVGWFGLPLLVFAGGLLLCLPLLVLRDQPWVVSIPAFLGVGAIGIGALYFVDQAEFLNIITGQGYFVKTLIYSTVAEAQAPSIDQLILGYGVLTFFLAFVGLALWVYKMARARFPRVMMMAVVFAVISIYLPISAAKFFLLGSAIFALLPAEALIRALDAAEFPKLRRTVAQLSDRRSQAAAFRRAFKVRHALILLLVVGLLVPNIWYAVDGGIAYNYKGTYSQQIYNSLPGFLQTSPANASSFYLGAAGTELDTPPQYDEAGYNWLATQDQNLTPADRPAFVSWWDYGFQAIAEGQHPSVADNFQNGIDPSGNFLLSQNESLAIGVLTTTLLTAEAQSSGQPNLPASLDTILAGDGVDLTELHLLMNTPNYDIQLVEAHPERYLPVDPSHLDGQNAMYDTVSWFLASTRSTNGMAQVYNDVQRYTHWSIRYAMVDDRLFPYSGQDTGIFYAPADLTDRLISSGGAAVSYYNVNITGSDGNTYPYGPLPAGVTAEAYPITYYPSFYNSMIYHIFIGYNSTQVGLGTSPSAQIPGVTLSTANPEPGWMMSHFQVVYQTAYYCPYSNPSGHPGCEVAMNLPQAQKLAKENNGSVDDSESTYANSGGETILEYYPGQPVSGTVQLPDGAPVAGVRVTVVDAFGIPHQATTTGPQGQYSLILPPGNDTINVTTGRVDLLTQQGSTSLLSIPMDVPAAYGLSLDATPLVRPITLQPARVSGTVYWNTADNDTYQPNIDPLAVGAKAVLWGQGTPRTTLTDASGSYQFLNVAPGTYNLTVLYRGTNYTNTTTATVYAEPGQLSNHSVSLEPSTLTGRVLLPDGSPSTNATVQVSDSFGPVANATVEATGNYSVPNLPTGNLSVRAYVPGEDLESAPTALSGLNGGLKLTENLTLQAYGRVSLTVLSDGAPVPGFPVRFVPIVPFTLYQASAPAPTQNGSVANGTSPNSTVGNGGPAHANATVLVTGPGGTLSGLLPLGNYSVYGLGLVGTVWSAGIGSATVGGSTTAIPPLNVAPAGRVQGTILPQGPSTATTVQVLAYDRAGQLAWTFTNNTGAWGLSLPYGTYSLLAIEAPSKDQAQSYAQMGTVTIAGPTATTVALPLGIGTLFRPSVGPASTSGGAPQPMAGVRVQVSFGGASELFTAVSNASGNVTLYLPLNPSVPGTFCVNATAPGFQAYSRCDLAAAQLNGISQLGLTANFTDFSATLTGLPYTGHATVNVTAESDAAVSTTLRGQGTISTTLSPGTYQLTGWAPAPPGSSGLYQVIAPRTVVVPVGGTGTSVTLAFAHVVRSNATLHLPVGMSATNATVHLYSSAGNFTETGANYIGHFLVTPGVYTVLATAQGRGTFASLSSVTFNATGVANHPVSITSSGTTLTLNLSVPGSTIGNGSLAGRLFASNGLDFPAAFSDARLVEVVPSNLSYTAQLAGTALLATDGTTAYANVTVGASQATCTPVGPATLCTVNLTAVPEISGISGTLTVPGFPGVVPGTLEIAGATSGAAPLTVDASNGTFSVALAPGVYTIYAHTPGTTGLFANLSEVTVGPTPTVGLTVTMTPAWIDAVTLEAPSTGAFGTGSVVVTTPSQLTLTFDNLSVGAPQSLVLPTGTYTIYGTGSGNPYGVEVNASATTSVALYQGNAATNLALAWQFHQIVLFHVPIAYATLGNGGSVTLPFSVQNVGNEPYKVEFIGSPVTFNFTFSPANGSLGLAASNDSLHGAVTIVIPAGTAVAHAPIQLEAKVLGGSGAVAGFASPAPVLNLTPVYGLTSGEGTISGASAAPYNISLPYYVRNTGTVPETVNLTFLDGARVTGLGWTLRILQGTTVLHDGAAIAAGSNSSFTVQLNATPGRALPPGSVTVIATVNNGSGAVRSTAVLDVPTTSVQIAGGLAVAGPQVGSPPNPPVWVYEALAFVPAIAFGVVAVSYRWYRTRRWTRR